MLWTLTFDVEISTIGVTIRNNYVASDAYSLQGGEVGGGCSGLG